MVVQVEDRRVFDRVQARFPLRFKDSILGYGSNVFLRDISAQGAKIASKEELHIDDRLDLLVELPDGHEPLSLKGRVTWARNTSPNSWDAGLQFDKVRFMTTQRIFQFCQ